MKLNDLGISLVLVSILFIGISAVIHKHKTAGACAECEEIAEHVLENAADEMLHVPNGTSHALVIGADSMVD